MGIFINQGKQDTSQDRSFEPIKADKVTAVIEKVELDTKWERNLLVTFKIIDGEHKGRLIWDRVHFLYIEGSDKFNSTWKYRSLRKAACVPYNENEPAQIDIEGMLVGKAVDMKLFLKDGKEGAVYQGVKFLVNKERLEAVMSQPSTPVVEAPTVEISDDDLPFDNSPADEESPW